MARLMKNQFSKQNKSVLLTTTMDRKKKHMNPLIRLLHDNGIVVKRFIDSKMCCPFLARSTLYKFFLETTESRIENVKLGTKTSPVIPKR